MKRSILNKATQEDKFERKWWVNNKAKQSWIRWQKRANNKALRRTLKKQLEQDCLHLLTM